MNVLAMLDEECKVPKGSDASWLGKMNDSLAVKPSYVKTKIVKANFGIKHFAGEVL